MVGGGDLYLELNPPSTIVITEKKDAMFSFLGIPVLRLHL